MATDLQTAQETSIPSLIQGIVHDVGEIVKQELRFAKVEIRSDLRKSATAARLLGSGIALAGLGALLLVLMLVHLLHWLTAPAGMDPAGLPLWACYALVGGLILATGVGLAVAGKKKFDSFNPLPDETAQSLKENIEWITNSK